MSDPRLTRLGQVEERRAEFLWPDRVPLGGLTVLDGDPGCGKSTMMDDIAARVTTGSPMPDSTRRSQPAGVVLLSGEDSLAQDVKPRLRITEQDSLGFNGLEGVLLQSKPGEDGRSRNPWMAAVRG